MEDECGYDLLGADVAFGPMTEAESKAADAAKAKAKPTVMTFEPENIWLKPSTWFKASAWAGGPPRWQLALAGSVAGLGLGALLFGAVKK